MSHVRSRLVVAAIAALALAGCAVPGQGSASGTAAEFDGVVITNSQVDAAFGAWIEDSDGALVTSRDEVLTLALLHDELMAACVERGMPIDSSNAAKVAQSWLDSLGVQGKPSPDFVRSFEAQFALAVLALGAEPEVLASIIADVEQNAVVSPRAGKIDADAFLASVTTAVTTAAQQELGAQSYIPFQHVNAFSDVDASWLARG